MTKTSAPTKAAPARKAKASAEPETKGWHGLDLGETNNANFRAVLETNEAMFGAMATLNQELASFATQRLRDNLARSQAMMKCEQPEELLRAQMDYNKVIFEQYLIEGAKLMTMAARVTEQCWQPIEARLR